MAHENFILNNVMIHQGKFDVYHIVNHIQILLDRNSCVKEKLFLVDSHNTNRNEKKWISFALSIAFIFPLLIPNAESQRCVTQNSDFGERESSRVFFYDTISCYGDWFRLLCCCRKYFFLLYNQIRISMREQSTSTFDIVWEDQNGILHEWKTILQIFARKQSLVNIEIWWFG